MSPAFECPPPGWVALARELAPLAEAECTFWREDFCVDFLEVE